MSKIALVIEGGGFKSVFSAGVLDAFIINNFNPFDIYLGVSSGAMALSYYLGDQYKAYFSISHKVEINKAKITDFIISNKRKFQIFFFDPPFKDQNFLFVLKMIREKKIYESNHILIIHREKNSFQNFNKYFNTEISRKYGRSEIFFGTFS